MTCLLRDLLKNTFPLSQPDLGEGPDLPDLGVGPDLGEGSTAACQRHVKHLMNRQPIFDRCTPYGLSATSWVHPCRGALRDLDSLGEAKDPKPTSPGRAVGEPLRLHLTPRGRQGSRRASSAELYMLFPLFCLASESFVLQAEDPAKLILTDTIAGVKWASSAPARGTQLNLILLPSRDGFDSHDGALVRLCGAVHTLSAPIRRSVSHLEIEPGFDAMRDASFIAIRPYRPCVLVRWLRVESWTWTLAWSLSTTLCCFAPDLHWQDRCPAHQFWMSRTAACLMPLATSKSWLPIDGLVLWFTLLSTCRVWHLVPSAAHLAVLRPAVHSTQAS